MFGSPEYAKEELRAEISSAFTAQAVGITYEQNSHMENHKAYIQSWISALKNNPNELFLAIKDAEKISDYLIEKAEVEKEMSNEKSLTKEMEDYEDEHRRQLENLKRDKTPVVINGYGGREQESQLHAWRLRLHSKRQDMVQSMYRNMPRSLFMTKTWKCWMDQQKISLKF